MEELNQRGKVSDRIAVRDEGIRIYIPKLVEDLNERNTANN